MNRPKRSTRQGNTTPVNVEDDDKCVYKVLDMLVWAIDATARYDETVEEMRKVQRGESDKTMAEVLAGKKWSELATEAQKECPLGSTWKRMREKSESEEEEDEEESFVDTPAKKPKPSAEKPRTLSISASKKSKVTPKKKETGKAAKKNCEELEVPNIELKRTSEADEVALEISQKLDDAEAKELPPVLEKQIEHNEEENKDALDNESVEEKPQLEEQIIREEHYVQNVTLEQHLVNETINFAKKIESEIRETSNLLKSSEDESLNKMPNIFESLIENKELSSGDLNIGNKALLTNADLSSKISENKIPQLEEAVQWKSTTEAIQMLEKNAKSSLVKQEEERSDVASTSKLNESTDSLKVGETMENLIEAVQSNIKKEEESQCLENANN